MTIKLQELLEEAKLTDDQLAILKVAQTTVDKTISDDIKTAELGLKNKNQELLTKLKDAKEKIIPDGFDMDGYNDYVSNKDKIAAEKAKVEEDALIATENWNKLKNDMTNNHEKSIKDVTIAKDQEITNLRLALDNELIENVALKEIEKVDGSSILLMPHIKDSIKTNQNENGKYEVQVTDQTGAQRMNAETGEPFKVSDLIAELQADKSFAGAFPIQNKGSNTNINANNSNFNSTNNPFEKGSKHYSITEQAKLAKTNPTLAKTLKESANV